MNETHRIRFNKYFFYLKLNYDQPLTFSVSIIEVSGKVIAFLHVCWLYRLFLNFSVYQLIV